MPTSVEPLRSATARNWLVVPAVLLSIGLAALLIDVPVARFCHARSYPRLVTDIFNNTEPFGHAVGVALIAATVAVFDVRRRPWASSLCLCGALGGGLAANLVKLVVGRTRPRNFDFALTNVADTFTSLLPLGSGGSAVQSFPSAHTATATGLAVALAALYPQGRWWFATLAVLVAMHRVESSAHYVSDVCAGAIVGWLIGHLCVHITARMSLSQGELARAPIARRRAA